jgi:hypothetical protein
MGARDVVRRRARRAGVLATLLVLGVSALVAAPARATVTRPAAYVFGDSLSFQADPYLKALPTRYAVTQVVYPGVAPCDWLQWGKTKALPKVRPSLAIVETAGINRQTACMKAGGAAPAIGSPAFTSAYETALATLFGDLVRANPRVHIDYVGSPPMQDATKNAEGETLFVWAANEHARYRQLTVSFAPRTALADVDGAFTARLPCLSTETAAMGCTAGWIPVRDADGVHFYCPHWGPRFSCDGYDGGAKRWSLAVDRLVPKQP